MKTPCFVLNLPQDKEKRRLMQAEADNCDIKMEFFTAVNGRDLSKHDMLACSDHEKSREKIGRVLTRGEIGCALSHRALYKNIVESGLHHCLILEDDVEIGEDFARVVKEILEGNHEFDILLLGSHISSCRHTDVSVELKSYLGNTGRSLGIPSEKAYGTYGYIVSNNGAHVLLEMTEKIFMPIDHYTGDGSLVNLMVLVPSVVKVSRRLEKFSNISKERNKLARVRPSKKYSIKKNIVVALGLYGFYLKVISRRKKM